MERLRGKSLDYHGSMALFFCSLPVPRLLHFLLSFAPMLHTRLGPALAALATLTAYAQPAPAPEAPTPQTTAAPPEQALAGLDGPLFYELLVGEMSATHGDASTAIALLLDAARQTQSQALYRRATDIALRARSGPRALEAAQAWQQAFPDARDANRYLLQILLMLNRVSESETPLARELAHTPVTSKPAVYLAIAQLYRHVSDKALAAAVVEQALQADLHHSTLQPNALTLVGHLRLAAGQKTLALQAVQQAHALAPDNGASALLALELLENQVPEAESILQRYLEREAAPTIRLAYARVLMDRQQLAAARTELQAVLVHAPQQADAWFALAAVHAQLGQWEQAEQALQSYLPLLERIPEAAQRRHALQQASLLGARSALQANQLERATQWLQRVDGQNNLLGLQSLRAAVLARQGQLEQGRALIRATPSASVTEDLRKQQAEVQLLRDAGAYPQAYALQTQLQQAHPADPDITYETALLAERVGELDAMEALLRSVMVRHPDYHHAFNALGYALADRGERLDEARALIQHALQLAPNDPFITDSLGWVEFRQGNLPAALALLEQAYALRDDVEIATHLGEVHWAMGQRDRALILWRQAQQRDPDNAVLRATLQRLQVQP